VPAPEEAEQESPPQGESIPSSYEESLEALQNPDSSGLPTPARISLEVMGGAAGGALSGVLALLAAKAVLGNCGDNPGCIITGIGTTAVAIVLGAPLGVTVVGQLAGGRGSYWPSLLGMAVGSGTGIVLAAALNRTSEVLRYASLVVFPLIGAVVGYELWHAYRTPDRVRLTRGDAAGSSLPLIPWVGFTPAGGVLGGLAARF
jgi:hypothetical protein